MAVGGGGGWGAEPELLRTQENLRALLWLPGGVWKGSWGTVKP